jgi:hypothetical protein
LILFEDIFREIEALFNECEGFSKIAMIFKFIFSGLFKSELRIVKKFEAFLKHSKKN